MISTALTCWPFGGGGGGGAEWSSVEANSTISWPGRNYWPLDKKTNKPIAKPP